MGTHDCRFANLDPLISGINPLDWWNLSHKTSDLAEPDTMLPLQSPSGGIFTLGRNYL